MTPLVCLWPSPCISSVMKATDIASAEAYRDWYASVQCAEMSVEAISAELSAIYRRMIPLTAVDTTLHVVAVIPLWAQDFTGALSRVATAVSESRDPMSLHVIALRRGLERLDDKTVMSDINENERIKELDTVACNGDTPFTYSLIDDYVGSGASIDFSCGTLGDYLSLLFGALIKAWRRALNPVVFAGSGTRHAGIGVGVLSFDRKSASDYLLRRAFLSVLDDVDINCKRVDSQRAAAYSLRLLKGIDSRYPAFFNREVLPLLRDEKMDEGEIVAKIERPMNEEVADIERCLKSILDAPDLSLPEKEAVIALMLGRDNPRLSGVQYDRDFLLLDDAVSEPVNLYVDTFNSLASDSGLLPLRRDFKALRKYNVSLIDGETKEDIVNFKAFNPLDDIKRLKMEIMNNMAFIRRKHEELEQLTEAQRLRRIIDAKPVDSNDPRRDIQHFDVVEQPLDEIYRPAENLKPADSVDLRAYFPPAKDQGEAGACTTYSVVAMYEAMMRRQSENKDCPASLSEEFVYYYSNILTGRPDGGSNFYEQLSVLGRQGVCDRKYYNSRGAKPSDEAVEDASGHRVVKALQIPLVSTGGKMECIKANHRLLTSALSEGFPVGIALRIGRDFGSDGPYIHRLDEATLADGFAHAMVIAGYSEVEKCYIVRNSWGEDFGDNGYCYLSAAYVDDPELNTFACIIAETTDSDVTEHKIPDIVAPFAGTEAQINAAAIRNVLDEAEVLVRAQKKEYEELYRYYRRLVQRLCMPGVRNQLRKIAENRSGEILADIIDRKSELESSFVEKLKEFKRSYIKIACNVSCVALVYDVLAVLMTYYAVINFNTVVGWTVGCVSTAIAVSLWIHYKWAVRKYRRRLDAEIGDLAVDEFRARRDLFEKQLRFHVSGMWLDRIHDLTMNISHTYDRLVSFSNELRTWYAEDKDCVDRSTAERCPSVIRLNDTDLLDDFFRSNREEITSRINLMETFANYSIDSVTISEARNNLTNRALEPINALFADFSMSGLLLGTKKYPYMRRLDTEKELARLQLVGQVATRYSPDGLTLPVRMIFAPVEETDMSRWQNSTDPAFPFRPDLYRDKDTDSILLLTVHTIPIANLR